MEKGQTSVQTDESRRLRCESVWDVLTGALHWSTDCCENKQDSRGFRHGGDQLKQAPPISAGKARRHAAHSEPGQPPPRFSLAKVWWLKRGADTEICWMEGTSGRFLNLIPAVTGEKRKHGSRVCRRYNSRTGEVVFALLYFQRLNENVPLCAKIKACQGLYGGEMFLFNYSNVLRYDWTTTQNIKLLILAGLWKRINPPLWGESSPHPQWNLTQNFCP